MIFWTDIVFPIAIALFALVLIVFVLNLGLRLVHLDIAIFRIAGGLAIWYYVGPIIYTWLLEKIITVPREGIEIIYMPIHAFIEAFEKLV